jgi:hypothetical protein
MLINFAPNGARVPIAPGMIPNKRPSDRGMIDRKSCFVSPLENAIIAWRTIGMHISYVSRLATSSRSMNRIRHFLVVWGHVELRI